LVGLAAISSASRADAGTTSAESAMIGAVPVSVGNYSADAVVRRSGRPLAIRDRFN
jgi:hypothetical protein